MGKNQYCSKQQILLFNRSSRAASVARDLFEELYRITKQFNNQQDGGTSLFNFLGSRTGAYLISLLEHLSHEVRVMTVYYYILTSII